MDSSRLHPPQRLAYTRSRPSVGIRRLSSNLSIVPLNDLSASPPFSPSNAAHIREEERSSRRRSFSDPQRGLSPSIPQISLTRTATRPHMASLAEEPTRPEPFPELEPTSTTPVYDEMTRASLRPTMTRQASNMSMMSRAGTAAKSALGFGPKKLESRSRGDSRASIGAEYDSDIVDLLDVVGTWEA